MRLTAFITLTAAFAVVGTSLSPMPAEATVESLNEADSGFELESTIDWFEYGTGTKLNMAPTATDAFTDTELLPDGSVGLEHWIDGSDDPDIAAVPWWDQALGARQCSEVTASGVQFVDVPFDSMTPAGWAASGWIQADYGDLEVTVYDGAVQSAAPFWLATPFDTADGHVFAEVDFGAGSTRTVCLNFGHQTGGQVSASLPFLGQNWTGFVAIYEQVDPLSSNTFVVTNPTDMNVSVATSPGSGGAVTLAPGALAAMTLTGQDTIYATGAVNVRASNPNTDDASYATLFSQGTLFVSQTSRYVENWCFAGPNGTTVTIDPSNGAAVPITLSAAVQCKSVNTNAHTVITSSAPVSAYHVSTDGRDQHALYPATDDPLYGVPSTCLMIGVSGAGDLELARSGGTVATITTATTGYTQCGFGSYGTGEAYRVTPLTGQLDAAIQQADADGTASTSFLPIEAMSSRYVLPLASSYTAIACPRPGEIILVNGVAQTCAGTGVGKLLLGATAAGAVIESQSGAAFHLYYHPGTDETNIFVPRLNWAQVEAVADPIESLLAPSGTWTSQPTQAVTDVWGLFGSDETVPANTAVTWEVACAASAAGPFVFVAITIGDPLPHTCDAVDWVQVRATLATNDGLTTPLVLAGCPEYALVPIVEADAVTADVEAGQNWLFRIHAEANAVGNQSTSIETRTFTSTSTYGTYLVDGSMTSHQQVDANAPTAMNSPFSPVAMGVSSIFITSAGSPTVDELIWRTHSGTGVHSERTILLS